MISLSKKESPELKKQKPRNDRNVRKNQKYRDSNSVTIHELNTF